MNISQIDLNLLGAFDALMVERQVTRAARRLGISQPAMSDALRRLRLMFGDPLFVRASGAMQPTPRALAIAQETGPILQRIRAVMGAQVAFVPEDTQRSFTIASTDYTSLVLLPVLLPILRAEAPGVDLRIIGYEKPAIAGLLDRGDADMAIGVFSNPPQACVKTTLFEESFVGLARADHPLLASGAVSLADYASTPQAMVSLNADSTSVIDEVLRGLGLRRRIALVVPYMMLLPALLLQSDLIATLPRRAAMAAAAGGLRCFDLPFQTDRWTVDLLCNPSARTDKASAWLRHMIQRQTERI